jgi:hypothetical protein
VERDEVLAPPPEIGGRPGGGQIVKRDDSRGE